MVGINKYFISPLGEILYFHRSISIAELHAVSALADNCAKLLGLIGHHQEHSYKLSTSIVDAIFVLFGAGGGVMFWMLV